MDFASLARARRTVHDFVPEPVDPALIERAAELALWAPNHKLTFPIRFVDIGPAARARLIELALELKGDGSEAKRTRVRDALAMPSHLLALGLRRATKEQTRREDYATLAMGVQNACLFLWEADVATKWSSAGWSTHPRAYEILGLDPEDVTLEGCLMIGRARVVPPAPTRPAANHAFRRTE